MRIGDHRKTTFTWQKIVRGLRKAGLSYGQIGKRLNKNKGYIWKLDHCYFYADRKYSIANQWRWKAKRQLIKLSPYYAHVQKIRNARRAHRKAPQGETGQYPPAWQRKRRRHGGWRVY